MTSHLGRPSPDPWFGSLVELQCGCGGGLRDLGGIGKTLPGKGIALEEPPQALLQIEPARSKRDEDILDAGIISELAACRRDVARGRNAPLLVSRDISSPE